MRTGVLGGFRKKTGSVIGSYWRNLDVIRGLPRISSKPATQLQIDQRLKFGLVTRFLSRVGDIIDLGYNKGNRSKSSMNESVSHHLKHAILGITPNFRLDYSKLQLTSGVLELPDNTSAAAVTPTKVDFSWESYGANSRFKDDTDKVTLLIYNPVNDRFVTMRDVVPRTALAYSMQVPPPFSGQTVHCYIFLSSILVKGRYSNSRYLGEVVVL